MLAVTLAGGLAGALLLLWTPTTMFDQLLPWLLLVATLMLAAGPRLGAALRARLAAGPAVVLAIQVLLGLYGGYFGGAVGLMMIAAWSLLDGADFKALNVPTMGEAAQIYCSASGETVPDLNWYFSYNLFRLAGITQGIAGRIRDGTAASEKAMESAKRTVPLAKAAWAYAQKAGAT